MRALIEKAPQVAPGPEWRIHYACFARVGEADAARAEGEVVEVLCGRPGQVG